MSKDSSFDKTEEIIPPDRRLDAIARLINGKEVCTAVCFDGESIVIANNSGTEEELIKRYKAFFSRCANATIKKIEEDFKGEMQELLAQSKAEMQQKRADEEKLLQSLQDVKSGKITGLDAEAIVEEEKKILREVIAKTVQAKAKAEKQKLSRAERKLQELEKYNESNLDCLNRSLEDYENRKKRFMEEIEEQYKRLPIDIEKVAKSLANDSPQDKSFSPQIKSAFLNSKIVFIEPGDQKPHAEMQLLDRFINEDGKLAIPNQEVMEGKKPLYLGITKLCCLDCKAAIDAFNAENSSTRLTEIADDREVPELLKLATTSEEKVKISELVKTRGTHLKDYSGWVEPQFIQRNPKLKARFESIKQSLTQARRTTAQSGGLSEDPRKSLSPPGTPTETVSTGVHATSSSQGLGEDEERKSRDIQRHGEDTSRQAPATSLTGTKEPRHHSRQSARGGGLVRSREEEMKKPVEPDPKRRKAEEKTRHHVRYTEKKEERPHSHAKREEEKRRDDRDRGGRHRSRSRDRDQGRHR